MQSPCSTLGPDIPAGSTLDDLETLPSEVDILKLLNYPSRIIEENGDVKGIIWCGRVDVTEQEGSNLVDDFAENLEPHELLSSSTTVLDAVELFGTKENRYFYVIQRNKIVGILFYRDLFKPLGRLAFISVALEIENMALKLCQTPETVSAVGIQFLIIANGRLSNSSKLATSVSPSGKRTIWNTLFDFEQTSRTFSC